MAIVEIIYNMFITSLHNLVVTKYVVFSKSKNVYQFIIKL